MPEARVQPVQAQAAVFAEVNFTPSGVLDSNPGLLVRAGDQRDIRLACNIATRHLKDLTSYWEPEAGGRACNDCVGGERMKKVLPHVGVHAVQRPTLALYTRAPCRVAIAGMRLWPT